MARITQEFIDTATLAEYIAALNAPVPGEEGIIRFPLTDDLSHWAKINVHTAEDLARYLDACCAREEYKNSLCDSDIVDEDDLSFYEWMESRMELAAR